jgi:hypothetical protein
MATIEHFYKCLSCCRHHEGEIDALLCCAYSREIFRCTRCGAHLPTQAKADEHQTQDRCVADTAAVDAQQSYASGFNNFSTP